MSIGKVGEMSVEISKEQAKHIVKYLALGLSDGTFKECVIGDDYVKRLIDMLNGQIGMKSKPLFKELQDVANSLDESNAWIGYDNIDICLCFVEGKPLVTIYPVRDGETVVESDYVQGELK